MNRSRQILAGLIIGSVLFFAVVETATHLDAFLEWIGGLAAEEFGGRD